jgi:hypothetical protein
MPENIVAILRTAEEAELRYLRATRFEFSRLNRRNKFLMSLIPLAVSINRDGVHRRISVTFPFQLEDSFLSFNNQISLYTYNAFR